LSNSQIWFSYNWYKIAIASTSNSIHNLKLFLNYYLLLDNKNPHTVGDEVQILDLQQCGKKRQFVALLPQSML